MRPIDLEFDPLDDHGVVLAACGYERRSSYLCRLGIGGQRLIAMTFEPTGYETENLNRSTYAGAGWELQPVDHAIDAAFDAARVSDSRRLAIDISSMPRKVLALIVERIAKTDPGALDISFAYCPGDFENSLVAAERIETLTAGPVSNFFSGSLRPASLPVGLVVGLGLEQHRALGLMELVEPVHTWLFSSDGADDRYGPATAEAHRELLFSVGEDAVLPYDLKSLESTYHSLESLSFATKSELRLIFAPSGPKIFSLACLLVAAEQRTNQPAVWRVGSAESVPPADVEELGDVVFSRWVHVGQRHMASSAVPDELPGLD